MSPSSQSEPSTTGSPARAPSAGLRAYLERSRVISLVIFILTVAAIASISFVELSGLAAPIEVGRTARIRITAETGFRYESALETANARNLRLSSVPPVYQVNPAPAGVFERHVQELLSTLEQEAKNSDGGLFREKTPLSSAALDQLARQFNAKGHYRVSAADLGVLLDLENRERRRAVNAGLGFLREIQQEGIGEDLAAADSGLTLFTLRRADGEIANTRVHTVGDALAYLHISLAADTPDRPVASALFRLLRDGVEPNLVSDVAGSERRRRQAIIGLRPVIVTVMRGQGIIEPSAKVTSAQYEMLEAYRAHVATSGGAASEDNVELFSRLVLVLAMVIASILYIRIEDRETLQSNARLGLLASVVIVNLLLVRLSYGLADLPFFGDVLSAAEMLPYVAPIALAPLVVAILIDAGSAIFMALLISIFTSVIYGNRIDLLVLTFLASLAGIFYAQDVRRRSRVVKAGTVTGLVVASFAILMGLLEQTPINIIVWQVGAGICTGIGTGIIVAGLLPILESLFRRTTDITLLELTDYNHPLLRLMQLKAPGTYHHSLVVAQLAENAASAIGANPLLSRVCALFHDVGKTHQPDYFTENQADNSSPHGQLSPTDSAMIIKAHVDRGVELAQAHRLPTAVSDVIQQHHGTTLVEYFYRKAFPDGKSDPVSETVYRYTGPKPSFKESVIIFLADPIEAATRSLRTVDADHLRDLIGAIFQKRIAAGELDLAPITFEEISRIQESFKATLLGMLHSRITYHPFQ